MLQEARLMMFLLRESRRKTPVTVTLKENERFLGDSAAGMVSSSPIAGLALLEAGLLSISMMLVAG